MPTVQICLASVERQLPTVTTTEANSSHDIANLYNSPDWVNGLFTEEKKLTSIDFRNNFFRSGFFSLLRTEDSIAKLDNWHISSAKHDTTTNITDPSFNLYNHVLQEWHTEIALNTWDVASQIFIRRDLWNLNKLKNWYLDHASYTWRELLKAFDQEEENGIQVGALDDRSNALKTSITQDTAGATTGTYGDLTATVPVGSAGVDARFMVVIGSGGTVETIAVTTRGSGYANTEILTIPNANIGGGGTDLKITLQDPNCAKFPITTRQDSNALKFKDHPIISLAYTNANATLTPIIVKLHFEIKSDSN